MIKADPRYQQWCIKNTNSNKYYKDDLTGKGWVDNPNEAAFYNKAQGVKVLTKFASSPGLKVVDGIAETNSYTK